MHFVQIFQNLVKNKKPETKFKTGVKWIAWSGILTVVGVGGWLIYIQNFNKSTDAVAVPVTKVERSNVEITVNQGGTVELGGQQSLKSPGEVAVERVLVKVGDRVQKGEKLLQLRNQEQQSSLANKDLEVRKQQVVLGRSRQKVTEAQEKLAVAQKELQKPIKEELEIKKQQLTLARSRQKVAEAKEKLAAEQKKLKNLETLSAKGFIPRDELEQQQATVRESQASLRESRLEVDTNRIEVQRLKAEKQQQTEQQEKVLTARSELQEARSEVDTNLRELQRLQVERQNTKEQLENNIVTAPITGKVLDVKVNQGDGVKPGDVLLTLGNPAKELVKLQVGTLDAAKIKVGQPARVNVIGPDSKEFSAKVQSVNPQAISSDNSSGSGGGGGNTGASQPSGQAKVPATVELSKPTGSLIPGSKVNVEIVVQQRPKVVAVNLEAIVRTEDKPFVWVLDNQGKAQKRNVTLGLEGATQVEVKSGLKPGDKVILPTPDISLEPGTPVIEAPAGEALPTEGLPAMPESSSESGGIIE